ncbi:ABC-2 type transport system permease protein [Bradyrhizobium sp. S3.14.4]
MSSATALSWFARHELRLAWREWFAMMTGGRRKRARAAMIGLLFFAALLHVPAWAVIGRFADLQLPLDKSSLIVISATIFLAWTLMLSQAIESVTRVFYARADLDLMMSSPATLANLFSVRIAAIALAVTVMALLFSTPFIDVLVIGGGARWLAAFGVVIAMGLSAAAIAIAVTILLFRLIGPARTRFVAQVLAAMIGAGFVIALQVAAIMSYGTLSRFTILTSSSFAAYAPDVDSIWWWPARATMGDSEALLLLLALGLVLLGSVMAMFSHRFADTAIDAAAYGASGSKAAKQRPFRGGSRQQALRRKEFSLLWRDPWLISQTLMQLLYLVPPALLLWRNFADSSAALTLITPVIVMAAGQLAGGLAMADDLGRGRARPGCDRTADAVQRHPRQDRGRADRHRRHLLPADRGTRFRLTVPGRGQCRGCHHQRGVRDCDPALVPGAGPAQPIPPPPDLVAARNLCRSLLLDRLGRQRGAAARAAACRPHQRPDHRGPHRHHLEVQPKAQLNAVSRAATLTRC